MKISLNWLKQFTTVKGTVDELVTRIGSQLGEVEEVINLGERYKGIMVSKVVSCEKHPNADKLSVCLVDDGKATKGVERNKDGLVQVVCGAPNVKAGLLVAWIPPGNIVPESYDGEQFKLDVRELRGVKSNGMLASQKELAIGDSHEGILVVDEPAKPGDSFASVYELDDIIIDIENKMFTHRPDCFGLLGVAREIAGISHIQFKSPDWYLKALPLDRPKGKDLPLNVKNEEPKLVPRFLALAMSGVKVTSSPLKMQSYLSRVGLKPINNVVDVTNYCMYLTAQPLHAYDYDKLLAQDKGTKAASLIAKTSNGSESISLLNGQTIKPRKEAIVITSKQRLVGVGGIIGGTETAVDKNTTNIVLEAATFDMYSIRKTSMEHGLFTDAVTRFNKGQSPLQNDKVIAYAVSLLEDIAGAQLASILYDEHKTLPKLPKVNASTQFINARLGTKLNTTDMTRFLTNVEFMVEAKSENLSVITPFWRTDIEIAEDIVEEVGRLYGYDALPLGLPTRDITPAKKDETLALKTKIRDVLSAAGANELLTYSFVSEDLLSKVEQNSKEAYKIANAISPELQYYRLSILPSLLDKVHLNIRAGYDEFALFELGKVHAKSEKDKEGLPAEFERLAWVFTASDKTAQNYSGAAYFQARTYLSSLESHFGVDFHLEPLNQGDLSGHKLAQQMIAPFDLNRSSLVYLNDQLAGVIGELSPSVRQAFKLPLFSAAFELFVTELQADGGQVYSPIRRFPSTQQDISFKVGNNVSYSELQECVTDELSKITAKDGFKSKLKPLDIYQAKTENKTKHISFRLELWHDGRTLKTTESNTVLEQIAKVAKQKLQAERL